MPNVMLQCKTEARRSHPSRAAQFLLKLRPTACSFLFSKVSQRCCVQLLLLLQYLLRNVTAWVGGEKWPLTVVRWLNLKAQLMCWFIPCHPWNEKLPRMTFLFYSFWAKFYFCWWNFSKNTCSLVSSLFLCLVVLTGNSAFLCSLCLLRHESSS